MLKKTEFDTLIKENLLQYSKETSFGYVVSEDGQEERLYKNYYAEEAWKRFVEEMKSPTYASHYERYAKGAGSELKPKRGRYGMMPPKMASVASSSRFCYLALRNGGEAIDAHGTVLFEAGFGIDGIAGTAPQLDAWFSSDHLFVEAKCHEIFDKHTIVLKKAYWERIFGKDNLFGLSSVEKNCGKEFQIPVSVFGLHQSDTRFDIKQFLCHLLGVASCEKHGELPIRLVYLFFKPKFDNAAVNNKIHAVFDELQEEIKTIFESTPIRNFTVKNNIQLSAVAEYDYVMRDLTKENIVVLYQ